MTDFYSINSLTFSYPKSDTVLENVSFVINKGEHIGLIGPNGSGKTTLTRLMMGILKPYSGHIMLNGNDISDMPLSEIGKSVGFVFQNPDKQLFAPSVPEQLSFHYRFKKKYDETEVNEKTDYYLDLFGLTPFKNDFPFNLSLGQKQRLALASIIIRNVDFLIMDEPGTGLDIYHLKSLSQCLSSLREENKGYLIISHDKKFLSRHVDKLLSIKDKGVDLI